MTISAFHSSIIPTKNHSEIRYQRKRNILIVYRSCRLPEGLKSVAFMHNFVPGGDVIVRGVGGGGGGGG